METRFHSFFCFYTFFLLERQGVGEGSKYILKVLTFLQAAFSNKKAIPVASTCEITKQNSGSNDFISC